MCACVYVHVSLSVHDDVSYIFIHTVFPGLLVPLWSPFPLCLCSLVHC